MDLLLFVSCSACDELVARERDEQTSQSRLNKATEMLILAFPLYYSINRLLGRG